MKKTMTPWELRGYLTYPHMHGKPAAGQTGEIAWCRGWAQAQREDHSSSQLETDLRNDELAGRNSYAAEYGPQWDQLNLFS